MRALAQPCRHKGQYRMKAGGAPGTKQKLPAAQERPMNEQAVKPPQVDNNWKVLILFI